MAQPVEAAQLALCENRGSGFDSVVNLMYLADGALSAEQFDRVIACTIRLARHLPTELVFLARQFRQMASQGGVAIPADLARRLDALAQAGPERICFAHIDLNDPEAEIAVTEYAFSRMPPGGILLYDDYGWAGYQAQRRRLDAWFKERGMQVTELPTGQGFVIRR